MSHQTLSLEALDTLDEVDTLCLFIGEDERPLQGAAGFLDWRLCGGLSRVLVSGFFDGKAGDSLLLPSDGRVAPQRVVALGIGKRASLDTSSVAEVLGRAVDVLGRAQVKSVALEVPGAPQLDEAARAAAFEQVFLVRFHGERVVVLQERQPTPPPPGAVDKRAR